MTFKILFMPAAALELTEAQDWYESKRQGLGVLFRKELDHQVNRISSNPYHFPEIHTDIRRALLRGYPYGLFFRILDDTIFVVACFHSSRNPLVWKSRT